MNRGLAARLLVSPKLPEEVAANGQGGAAEGHLLRQASGKKVQEVSLGPKQNHGIHPPKYFDYPKVGLNPGVVDFSNKDTDVFKSTWG